jgi:hypothetical protein
LESRKRWWRANRPATADLFDLELVEAVAVLAERAAQLPAACHLYCDVDEQAALVRIVSAWGAVRGQGPAL